MPRLQTLKPSVRTLKGTLSGVPTYSRQRTRALHTDSPEWKAIRLRVLLRDEYQCRGYEPGKHAEGCDYFATEVDHVDGDASHDTPQDLSNYQSLSKQCHSTKTAKEMQR